MCKGGGWFLSTTAPASSALHVCFGLGQRFAMSTAPIGARRPGPREHSPDDDDKDFRLEERIREQLVRSGERDRLKQLLRDRLVECGWRDDVKQKCKEFIDRRGRENVTTEDIVRHVRPEGRSTVPDSVKAELLVHIKDFITNL